MVSRFAAVTNKEILITNNQTSCSEIYDEGDKIWFLEALTGKALSVWLEFFYETGGKVFCLQMQIKSCIGLFSWLHK